MSKKLAVISVFVALCVVGMIVVSGCYEKTTALNQEKQGVYQKDVQTTCSKTLDASQKKVCGSKKSLAVCPADCKKVCCAPACSADCKEACCAAKQKAGTCSPKM